MHSSVNQIIHIRLVHWATIAPGTIRTMSGVVDYGSTFIDGNLSIRYCAVRVIDLINFIIGVCQQEIANIIQMLIIIFSIISGSLI